MRISYRLVSFDRQTDELIGSQAIPRELVSNIKKIAKIPRDDDGAGDYPVDAQQAHKIAEKLGIILHPESVDYFIEPYVYETDAEERAAGT